MDAFLYNSLLSHAIYPSTDHRQWEVYARVSTAAVCSDSSKMEGCNIW